VNTTGWLTDPQVTGDGTGILSHAGVAPVRALADNIGLTAGLSKALASRRKPGSSFVQRIAVNTGTVSVLALLAARPARLGRAGLTVGRAGRDGAAALVVRVREGP
jgi:hypothetical protein